MEDTLPPCVAIDVLIELAYDAPWNPSGALEILVKLLRELTKYKLSEYSDTYVVKPI
jgi:hypothetical protein